MRSKSRLFKTLTLFAFASMAAFVVMAFLSVQASSAADGDVNESVELATNVYMVRLVDPPLASYRGHINGLAATHPETVGQNRLDVNSAASVAYRAYLADQQADLLLEMRNDFGRAVTAIYNYDVTFNGVAVTLSDEEAAAVAAMPGVAAVLQDQWRYPTTDTTPDFIGATSIWDGSATPDGIGTKGEGVIVGVIDTGIWPEHPSFDDDGSLPAPPAGWNGACAAPQDATTPLTCTNKLIGARHFLTGYVAAVGGTYDGLFWSTRDDDGHGTHTASTAAGNEDVDATLLGVDRGLVSGIAPEAYVSAYKGLGPQGGVTSDLVASIDAAVADGVDVINYSIGGGSSDPWTDGDALAFLAARDAGVFVATSAGNSGPGPSTLGSPGDAPWITTVGASTSDRHFISDITISGMPGADLYGASVTTGVVGLELVNAENYTDSTGVNGRLCLNPFSPGTFTSNQVVFCERGQIARVLRGDHVAAGGGAGVILANPAQQGLSTDNYIIPAVHVENDVGDQIRTHLEGAGGTVNVTFTLGMAVMDDDPRVISDMMASFSSRGPTLQGDSNYIKPNVTAPGVQTLAGASPAHDGAGAQGELFQSIQGTSMSSPHVAGAGALLAALYPDWSASEIESVLMTTANPSHVKEDGVTTATPFDMGNGRIDLFQAALAGLVLHESEANYTASDPSAGGDPTTLNIASMANSQCLGTCSWTRTVSSTLDYTRTWNAIGSAPAGVTVTVTPDTFDLGPGATQDIDITIDVGNAASDGSWLFADVTLYPGAAPVSIDCNSSTVDFEGTPTVPSDWVIVQGPGNGWGSTNDGICGSAASGLGNYAATGEAACVDSDASGGLEDSYLCTPLIDLGSPVTAHLSFDANYQIFLTPGADDVFEVLLTPDASTFYTTTYSNVDTNVGANRVLDSGERITVSVSGIVTGSAHICWHYGGDYDWYAHVDNVDLSCSYGAPDQVESAGGSVAPARLPIAVIPVGSIVPPAINIETDMTQGSETVSGLLSVVDVNDLTADVTGLTIATQRTEDLLGDSDNSTPYDDLTDGVFWLTMTVGADATRLVAQVLEVPEDLAPNLDVDLFVGTGDTPSGATQVCSSTSSDETEYCNIDDPAAGVWWIVVQSWAASANAPDPVTLAYALVDSDEGNMTVTGPSGVTAGTPFDIDVNWDDGSLVAGDLAFASFTIGSGPADDDIGRSNVNFLYTGAPPAPAIEVSPDALEDDLLPNTVVTHMLTISNVGEGTLDWSVVEFGSGGGIPAVGAATVSLDNVDALAASSVAATAVRVPTEVLTDHLLFDQTADQNTSGSTSQFFPDFGGGSEAADDFVVPAGGWTVTEVRVPGFYTGVRIGDAINISFFADNGGIPSETPVYSAQSTDYVDNAGDFMVNLPTPAVLMPGTYWFEAQVVMPFNPDAEQWFWFTSASNNGSARAFRDLGDLFGVGCTVWATYTDCIAAGDNDLAFQLFGETGMNACINADEISWVNVTPTSGSTGEGEASPVYVSLDSTGVAAGTYTAELCVVSNDTANPNVFVPITMTVQADSDGIDDDIEDGAPNGGDGNDDGVADSTQDNVSSLPGQNNGEYLTLESSDGSLSEISSSTVMTLPDGVDDFPEGAIGFKVSDIAPGSSVMVTVTMHSGTQPTGYWKLGTDGWYEYANAEISAHATLTDTYVVVLTLTDGGAGDLDGEENGMILDPGAPAFNTVQSVFWSYLPAVMNN